MLPNLTDRMARTDLLALVLGNDDHLGVFILGAGATLAVAEVTATCGVDYHLGLVAIVTWGGPGGMVDEKQTSVNDRA
jgi:hypothetical protein